MKGTDRRMVHPTEGSRKKKEEKKGGAIESSCITSS
jgi:hypothetical protein